MFWTIVCLFSRVFGDLFYTTDSPAEETLILITIMNITRLPFNRFNGKPYVTLCYGKPLNMQCVLDLIPVNFGGVLLVSIFRNIPPLELNSYQQKPTETILVSIKTSLYINH